MNRILWIDGSDRVCVIRLTLDAIMRTAYSSEIEQWSLNGCWILDKSTSVHTTLQKYSQSVVIRFWYLQCCCTLLAVSQNKHNLDSVFDFVWCSICQKFSMDLYYLRTKIFIHCSVNWTAETQINCLATMQVYAGCIRIWR